jgi:hypothetical protein
MDLVAKIHLAGPIDGIARLRDGYIGLVCGDL